MDMAPPEHNTVNWTQSNISLSHITCTASANSTPGSLQEKGNMAFVKREKVWIPAEMNPSAPNSFCDGLSVGVGKVERETHKAVACRHSLQLLCGRPDGEKDHILAGNAVLKHGLSEWDLKVFPSDPTAPVTSPSWFKSRQQLAEHLKDNPSNQKLFFSGVWPPSPGSSELCEAQRDGASSWSSLSGFSPPDPFYPDWICLNCETRRDLLPQLTGRSVIRSWQRQLVRLT